MEPGGKCCKNQTAMKSYPIIYWEIVEEYNGSDEMNYEEIKRNTEAEYQRRVKKLKRKELLTN